jgi:hypothetical protein
MRTHDDGHHAVASQQAAMSRRAFSSSELKSAHLSNNLRL